MSKNKNMQTNPVDTEKEVSVISADKKVAEEKVETKPAQEQKEKTAQDKKGAKTKKKDKKEKGKLKRKAKETLSELKKVTWPSFGEVCKRTGVVLVVVLVFAIVLFGIDYGLGALMQLLTKR